MNDASRVCRLERFGHALSNRQRPGQGQRTVGNEFGQCGTFDELDHQGLDGTRLLDPVNGGDIGMVERGKHPRLTLETKEAIGIAGEEVRQNLEGNVTAQSRIAGAIDLAHAPRTYQGDDLVLPESLSSRKSHKRTRRQLRGHCAPDLCADRPH